MDLVFGPSTTQHTVNISINDDDLLEPKEAFVLELSLILHVPNVTIYPNFIRVTIVHIDGQFCS